MTSHGQPVKTDVALPKPSGRRARKFASREGLPPFDPPGETPDPLFLLQKTRGPEDVPPAERETGLASRAARN